MEKHTEQSMQKVLNSFLSNPRFVLKNLFVFDWESDLLFLTRSGYWYEIEIKISRSDFLADKKKRVFARVNGNLFCEKVSKIELLSNTIEKAPNYFYYAVPEGMVKAEEVPEYAGLIYVREYDFYYEKAAPKIRKDKIDPNTMGLLDKFYYNMQNAKSDAIRAKREAAETNAHYSDVKTLISNERSMQRSSTINDAISAFKKTCPNIGEYLQCTLEGRAERCGWCDRINEFEKKLSDYIL